MFPLPLCQNRLRVRQFGILVASLALSTLSCAPDDTTQPSTEPSSTVSTVAAVTYRVRDLGTLGGRDSRAFDINSGGTVVGESKIPSGALHAFRWKNGVMTDLGTLGGANSSAAAINNDGVIVGYAQNTGGRDRAVRWFNGGKRNLGTLGGRHSRATDINSSGWIVGWSLKANGDQHAFLWRNGVMTDLGTLGGSHSVATAIHGDRVVGYSTKAGSTTLYPFVWRNGVMKELPTLGGTVSIAWGVNSGRIVGEAAPPDADGDFSHAAFWSNNQITDLGRLNGDLTRALDVNADGFIIGRIGHEVPDCSRVDAFVWHQGTLTLLPFIGGENHVAGAEGINRDGLIVGFSETNANSGDCEVGNIHAALWRPI